MQHHTLAYPDGAKAKWLPFAMLRLLWLLGCILRRGWAASSGSRMRQEART